MSNLTKKEMALSRETPSEFLTVTQVAFEATSSEDYIRDEIARRRIAIHRFGRRILISRADLRAYLQRTRTAAFGE
jgi:excisionase family DNA binding protein